DSLRFGELHRRITGLAGQELLGSRQPFFLAGPVLRSIRKTNIEYVAWPQEIHVATDHPVGILMAKLGDDHSTPVSALGAEFLIPQDVCHERRPHVSGAPARHTWFG